MSILTDNNLDFSFKSFNSTEETSNSKYTSKDYGKISNQFSSVYAQQVGSEVSNIYQSQNKVYEPSQNNWETKSSAYENKNQSNSFEEYRKTEPENSQKEQTSYSPLGNEDVNGSYSQQQTVYDEKTSSTLKETSDTTSEESKNEKNSLTSKDNSPGTYEINISFRDKVEQLAYSKDVDQILGNATADVDKVSKQKSKLRKILENPELFQKLTSREQDAQTPAFDKNSLLNKASSRPDDGRVDVSKVVETKTGKATSIDATLREKLENLAKNITSKNQKTESETLLQNSKEVAVSKNEILKTPLQTAENSKQASAMADVDLSEVKIEKVKVKQTPAKDLNSQINELATKASLKQATAEDSQGSQYSFNQQNQSQDSKKELSSLNSILGVHSSSKSQMLGQTDFNKLLNTMEQQRTTSNSAAEQIANSIKGNINSTTGKSSISMILNPQSLGRVNIELVSIKGVLSAEIKTENEQTKELLTKNIESLKQTLQEQGVTVGNVVVKTQESSLSNNNFGKDFSQDSQKNFSFNDGKADSQKHGHRTNHESTLGFENNFSGDEQPEIKSSKISHNGLVDYTI